MIITGFFLINSIVPKTLAGSMRVDTFFLSIQKDWDVCINSEATAKRLEKGEEAVKYFSLAVG